MRIIIIMRMIIIRRFAWVALAAFFVGGCSAFERGRKVSGEVIAETTPGHVSEFKNKVKVYTDKYSARVNVGKYHAIYRRVDVRGLHRHFDWVGVGIHTLRGTDITYYQDTYENDYWMFDVTNTRKIRGRLSTIYGFYHLDKTGGGIVKSGGDRTTGVRIGVRYDFNKRFFANTLYEIGNNKAEFVEDRWLVGAGFKF